MAYRLNLLELPVDILSLILTPLLVSSTPISLCPCTKSPIDPTEIFLIHPALYAVAAPLFYKVNSFALDVTVWHAQHVRRLWQSGSKLPMPRAREPLLLTTESLKRVARLELRIDRVRGWLHHVVVPMIQDMVVQGSLEHFNLRISYYCERTQTWVKRLEQKHDEDVMAMLTRPPLDGLLRILADPYLRTAELWIYTHQNPARCPFHPDQSCRRARAETAETTGNGETGDRTSRGRDRDGAVEIDWRELRRVVDPEQRDVAVAWADDPRVMRHQE